MPSLPSNADFLSLIQAMTISGVERHYDYPPESIDIADGECAFPLLPSAEQGELVSTCIDQSKARAIDYVIIVDAAGQGTNAQNYAKLAALMDALEDALDALAVNFVQYSITTTGNYTIGGADYWAIVASITASEA